MSGNTSDSASITEYSASESVLDNDAFVQAYDGLYVAFFPRAVYDASVQYALGEFEQYRHRETGEHVLRCVEIADEVYVFDDEAKRAFRPTTVATQANLLSCGDVRDVQSLAAAAADLDGPVSVDWGSYSVSAPSSGRVR